MTSYTHTYYLLHTKASVRTATFTTVRSNVHVRLGQGVDLPRSCILSLVDLFSHWVKSTSSHTHLCCKQKLVSWQPLVFEVEVHVTRAGSLTKINYLVSMTWFDAWLEDLCDAINDQTVGHQLVGVEV